MENNVPKYTQESLTVRNNYYVVEDGGSFHYFQIKVDEATLDAPVMRFVKRPPVLREGIAYVNRAPYHVPMQDLLRGIVRKSAALSQGRVNARNRVSRIAATPDVTKITTPESGSIPGGPGHPEQPGTELVDEVEISAAADAAWQEQAQSLLHALHQEEGGEWEIAEIVQPGPLDADSAVSDT